MRTVFANLVFSAVLPLAMAASTVGGADKYPYVEGQEVIADIGGPVAVAKPWKTLEEVDDPLRHLVANASGVRFQPPTEVVDDILAQEKKNADTESLVDYECVLDILHMEHSLRFEGTLKCGEGGGGKPPRWALVGIDLMDLAIDSDNNNKYADPDMGKEERDMEEDEPGKIFLVDDDDLDYDGVPDFADGFSAWKETDYASVSSADPEEELPLVPVILEIRVSEKNAVILGSVGITFEYTMSDPDPAKGDLKRKKVGETEDGKPIYEYSATPGFRLWLSNAASRKKKSVKDGGDFVPASSGSQIDDAEFTLSDLKAPNSGTIRIKLYLEATSGAEDLEDQFITAKVTAKLKTDAGETEEIRQTDKVRIHPVRLKRTKWLVCHDPEFEKRYCLKKKGKKKVAVKQARLMNNKAKFAITPIDGKSFNVILSNESGKVICQAHESSDSAAGDQLFEFRTDADGKNGADTDSKGRVYVEGKLLKKAPGKYFVSIQLDGKDLFPPFPLRVAPLLSSLRFSPGIEKGESFDPYSDELMADSGNTPPPFPVPGGPPNILPPTPPSDSKWFGMEIWYKLSDHVEGAISGGNGLFSVFGIENDKDAAPKRQGDIETIHLLRMDDDKLLEGEYDVKWEGFNDDFDKREKEGEKIDEIYKEGEEAALKETWGPPSLPGDSGRQEEKGVGAQSVCAEGKYNMRVELKRKEDEEQVQRYSIKFEVEYETE